MVKTCAGLLAAVLSLANASAAILDVGPGQKFARPSEAIAKARDGDTVRVAAGEYEDCASIKQNRLTLEGPADASAVMKNKSCAGKAILVIDGNDVTVRGLIWPTRRCRTRTVPGSAPRAAPCWSKTPNSCAMRTA